MSDANNNIIQKVSAQTGANSIIAGSLNPQFTSSYTQLNFPTSIVVDTLGNVIFSDTSNHVVRQIYMGTPGWVLTVAGSFSPGYCGDGSAARKAALNYPGSLALDSLGNLFIADTANYAIRRVAVGTAIITTVAGKPTGSYKCGMSSPTLSPNGVGIRRRRLQLDYRLLISPSSASTPSSGSYPSASTPSSGSYPSASYPSSGSYPSASTPSSGSYPSAGTPSSVSYPSASTPNSGSYPSAGTPSSGSYPSASYPSSVSYPSASYPSSGSYPSASYPSIITPSSVSSPISAPTASPTIPANNGGSALLWPLGLVSGLAVDSTGTISFSDLSNYVIRTVKNNVISTIAGQWGAYGSSGDGGTATSCKFSQLSGLSLDSLGNVYVGDSLNAVIRKISVARIVMKVAGSAVASIFHAVEMLFQLYYTE